MFCSAWLLEYLSAEDAQAKDSWSINHSLSLLVVWRIDNVFLRCLQDGRTEELRQDLYGSGLDESHGPFGKPRVQQ